MEKNPDYPQAFVLSIRLYQALLAVYPAEFRQAYGGPMKQLFHDCCRRALRDGGASGLLTLWVRTVYDIVKSAIEEHSQRGVDMSKETFYKLSGWAMIVGPVLFLIGAWAKNRPPFVQYAASSLPIDRYAIPAATPLLVVGMAFMCLGIFGILLRYAPKLGTASILLGIGIFSGLASSVGLIMLGITDSSPWWEIFILGMGVQYLALAFFGFITLRQKLLPRWNGLPVLGLWFPILLVLSMGLVPWEISNQMLAWAWLLSCIMFAGLGYLLKSGEQAAQSSAGTA